MLEALSTPHSRTMTFVFLVACAASATAAFAVTVSDNTLLQAVSVAAFFLAVFLFPPAFLIGAAGWVVMGIRTRRRPA